MDDQHPIRTFIVAIFAFAVVWAYFNAPLLRFADPAFLALAGSALAVGAGLSLGHTSRWQKIVALFATGIGVLSLALLINAAIQDSIANQGRCLALQNDMLSASPLRSDGPALFQALGCRPQGGGTAAVMPRRATSSGNVSTALPADTRHEEARTALTPAELKELQKDLQRGKNQGTEMTNHIHAGH